MFQLQFGSDPTGLSLELMTTTTRQFYIQKLLRLANASRIGISNECPHLNGLRETSCNSLEGLQCIPPSIEVAFAFGAFAFERQFHLHRESCNARYELRQAKKPPRFGDPVHFQVPPGGAILKVTTASSIGHIADIKLGCIC